jgi:hypothetical protein
MVPSGRWATIAVRLSSRLESEIAQLQIENKRLAALESRLVDEVFSE